MVRHLAGPLADMMVLQRVRWMARQMAPLTATPMALRMAAITVPKSARQMGHHLVVPTACMMVPHLADPLTGMMARSWENSKADPMACLTALLMALRMVLMTATKWD